MTTAVSAFAGLNLPTEDYRRHLQALEAGDGQSLVLRGFDVTPVAATMTSSVAAGAGVIVGTESVTQGAYPVVDNAANVVTHDASDPTNPRIDLIGWQLVDPAYSGLVESLAPVVVPGTPDPAPVAPTAPDNFLTLASVLVPAAATDAATFTYTDLRDFQDFDVRRFGVVGDGVTDDTAAWQAMLDALPAVAQGWGDSGQHWEASGTVKVQVPDDFICLITSSLTIGDGTNVVIETSDWGARLVWGGAPGGYMFDEPLSSVGTVIVWRGLVFDGAGVRVAGPARGHVRFERCNFVQTDSPAVDLVDTSAGSVGVVFATVQDCTFHRCAGGVWQRSDTYNLTTIERSAFRFMRDTSVKIDGQGVTMRDLEFFGVVDPDTPFIHLDPTNHAITNITMDGIRFGPEGGTAGETYIAPKYSILSGTTNPADNKRVGPVLLRDIKFFSATTPSATTGVGAILLNAAPVFWDIDACYFRDTFSSLIEEAWVTGSTVNQPSVSTFRRNWFDIDAPKTFSHGGSSWLQERRNTGVKANGWAANLLPSTDFSAVAWAKVSTTVAKDAVGPDGVASSAWTLTRTVTAGNSSIRDEFNGPGGVVTFTVWARSATLSTMRLALQDGSRHMVDNNANVPIDTVWRPYSVSGYVSAGIANVAAWIYAGSSTSAAGTIEIWGPHVALGESPHPLSPVLAHSGSLVGFYGAAPVAKAANPGAAAGTDAAVVNAIVTALRNLGLVT